MTIRTGTRLDLDAIRAAYLGVPDEAVFLQRARILMEAIQKYRDLPPCLRQGRIVEDLCNRVPIVVNPCDVFLARLLEEIPSASDESLVRERPELFTQAGVPGYLDSAGIYCPDWGKLLDKGLSGLIEEVRGFEDAAAGDGSGKDYLQGVGVSLEAVSILARRFAAEAAGVADGTTDPSGAARLREAAEICRSVASQPPQSFREALQLLILFHMVLSCLVGARNVTPGRMDRYLARFYESDLAAGRLSQRGAVELLAAVMIMLSQGSGQISTDFQSVKRTPNKHSHYYITLGGCEPDGSYFVNDLSFALMEAQTLAGLREPSLEIRYAPNIDRRLWHDALVLMRDGRPVLVYNDDTVVAGLVAEGIPKDVACDYVHAGCMNVLLPGHGNPCFRDNLNVARLVLCVTNAGRASLAGDVSGRSLRPPAVLASFDDFLEELRLSLACELQARVAWYETMVRRLPLAARPLFAGHIENGYEYREGGKLTWDVHLTGIATVVDSLLAVSRAVYEDRLLTLAELADALRENFNGREHLRLRLRRMPSYGTDAPEVLDMIDRVADLWTSEVEAACGSSDTVRLRAGFHSWLFNIDEGKCTGATPDGRKAGDCLSSDFLPSHGKGHTPTATLRCIARLTDKRAPSGGTTFSLDASHFQGDTGLKLLSALIEGYFAEGGLQLHLILSDADTLCDAVEHPERHADLLVRVTGYSEYFVRLLPEVQQDIIRRTQGALRKDRLPDA